MCRTFAAFTDKHKVGTFWFLKYGRARNQLISSCFTILKCMPCLCEVYIAFGWDEKAGS